MVRPFLLLSNSGLLISRQNYNAPSRQKGCTILTFHACRLYLMTIDQGGIKSIGTLQTHSQPNVVVVGGALTSPRSQAVVLNDWITIVGHSAEVRHQNLHICTKGFLNCSQSLDISGSRIINTCLFVNLAS